MRLPDDSQACIRSALRRRRRTLGLTQEDAARVHGDDERLPLAAFAKGVDLITRIVAEFAVYR